MRANHFRLGLLALIMAGPTALHAEDPLGADMMVESAFAEAKSAVPSISIEQIECVSDQRQIALANQTRLTFPCELQELVEDRHDAAMLVTLLLAEPAGALPENDEDASAAKKAAAIGAVVAGVAFDPGSELAVVERARLEGGLASPSLAGYAPANSRTLKLEAARLQREEALQRTSVRNDETVRASLREKREAEQARQAEHASVTQFLELANKQGFCPADGRIYLQRASEYAISPVQEDRIYGLWADDKRHALEPYLNDLSRCR